LAAKDAGELVMVFGNEYGLRWWVQQQARAQMSEDLVRLLTGRRGHFQMESGYHGDSWFGLNSLFDDAEQLRPFVAELTRRLKARGIEAVCGPMVGGARLVALVARELGTEALMADRVEGSGDSGVVGSPGDGGESLLTSASAYTCGTGDLSMSKTTLSLDEFTADAASVINHVIASAQPVVVKRGEDRVVIRPLLSEASRHSKARKTRERQPTQADVDAFLASAGSWKDVDTDSFLRDTYASRDLSVKPPVEL
jgi:hypothetical protein